MHNYAKLSQDSGRQRTNTDQKHLQDIKLEFKCDKLKNSQGQATRTQNSEQNIIAEYKENRTQDH